ncbi:MAG: hypothetical protein CTY12_00875 [Methylotenera sp.]|nr:MAG: hypothetical protein CTY12_00875 [Methylotenera sp.]
MFNYVLPIIWSFYTYIIQKALPVLLFIGILFLFWIGGFDFPRAPITAYVILFDITSVVLGRILISQTLNYLKYNGNNDRGGDIRESISDILVMVVSALFVSLVLIVAAFNQI